MTRVVTRWWWVRHAPAIGHGGAIYGNSEVDCDVSDTDSYAGLSAMLPDEVVWVTSHLSRTKRTAQAIFDARGNVSVEPAVEFDLAEQDFGDWHGRSHADLERDGIYHKFWTAPAHHAPPGGESFAAVIERVGSAVARLTKAHAGNDIVAVAHGGTIRAALALALKLDPESALAFAIQNLSLTRIDHISAPEPGGDWRVVHVNRPPK